uniref:Uncharacterized protein n=1 Tax=Anguilla anguilla TaxID=7936 RepID=A0A0E9WNT1_ANGAN
MTIRVSLAMSHDYQLHQTRQNIKFGKTPILIHNYLNLFIFCTLPFGWRWTYTFNK